MRIGLLAVCLAGCGFSLPEGSPGSIDSTLARDGSPADAKTFLDAPPPFDPATCPAGYVAVTGHGSRYRWGASGGMLRDWTTAESICEGDVTTAAPRPHLFVADEPNERTDVWAKAAPPTNASWSWTGMILRPSDHTWASITGTTLAPLAWGDPNGMQEPQPTVGPTAIVLGNDNRGNTAVYMARTIDWQLNVLCECDGRPVIVTP